MRRSSSGSRCTGSRRPSIPSDGAAKSSPNSKPDLTTAQFEELSRFVAGLPPPRRLWPTDPEELRGQVGEKQFARSGCAVRHRPTLGNAHGLYSDLLIHDMGQQFRSVAGLVQGRGADLWRESILRQRAIECHSLGRHPVGPVPDVADAAAMGLRDSGPYCTTAGPRRSGRRFWPMAARRPIRSRPINRCCPRSGSISASSPVAGRPRPGQLRGGWNRPGQQRSPGVDVRPGTGHGGSVNFVTASVSFLLQAGRQSLRSRIGTDFFSRQSRHMSEEAKTCVPSCTPQGLSGPLVVHCVVFADSSGCRPR